MRRIVRYTAAHHRVFHEPKKGFIAHTAASKLLAESDQVKDIMGLVFDECWPAHSKVSELWIRAPLLCPAKTNFRNNYYSLAVYTNACFTIDRLLMLLRKQVRNPTFLATHSQITAALTLLNFLVSTLSVPSVLLVQCPLRLWLVSMHSAATLTGRTCP